MWFIEYESDASTLMTEQLSALKTEGACPFEALVLFCQIARRHIHCHRSHNSHCF